jgi:hypothetical protein
MEYVARILDGLEPQRQIPAVEALARVLPPSWVRDAVTESGRSSARTRLLPAEITAWIVLLLGLFRRLSYANLLGMLYDASWTPWRGSAHAPPTPSALTRARDRLGVEPLQILFDRSAKEWLARYPGRDVCGHRLFALDGSCALVPDSAENRAHFGAPASTRGRTGYPQLRMVALLDVGTEIVVAQRVGPFWKGEMTLTKQLLPDVPLGAFVVMDRLFYCYEFLWNLWSTREAHFVVRLRKGIVTRRIRRLGKNDFLVEVTLPRSLKRLGAELPATWILREVMYRPEGATEDIRVLTSWLDPNTLPAPAVAALYHERWSEETVFDELKAHQCACAVVSRPTALRSLTPTRVLQELLGVLLAHNAVRVLMAEAGDVSEIPPRRLSFIAALERTREAVRDMMQLPTSRLVERYDRLLRSIGREIVPFRPGRHHPRAVKVKMSKYQVKRYVA